MSIHDDYLVLKRDHPDALVFLALGDFYETSDDDATTVSRALDLVLTSRPVGGNSLRRIPMPGFPIHIAENYVGRLVAQGYRVALAEPIGTREFYPEAGPLAVSAEMARPVAPEQMRLPLG